jgi:hypothetical protein
MKRSEEEASVLTPEARVMIIVVSVEPNHQTHQQNPELGAEKSPYMQCHIWHIVRHSAVQRCVSRYINVYGGTSLHLIQGFADADL